MAIQTRLGQIGFGHQPYAGFIAKAEATSGPHPFTDGTRLGQMGIGVQPYPGFLAKTETTAIAGNIIFSQSYNMIHPVHETHLRATNSTELIVRKRDKKPIISGGDH